MKKQIIVVTVLVVTFGAVLGLLLFPSSKKRAPTKVADGQTSVVSSFYPLSEFSSRIGGEHVLVTTVTPAGTEPHDFEPAAKDIAGIFAADVFLYNGGGVDAWASKVAPEALAKGVVTVEMSQHMGDLMSAVEESEEEPGHEEETFDEHFWLSPRHASKEALVIRDTLVGVDSANTGTYAMNTLTLTDELTQLDAEFKAGLADCQIRSVITSHAAFAYLAREYNFEMIAIAGISPEEEPSAGKLAEIAEMAKKRGIKYIFFETLVSPKLSETLAAEIGAQTLVFNPIEGLTNEDITLGRDYFTIMRQNLENLRTAMVCK